jgi:hypothetical protein
LARFPASRAFSSPVNAYTRFFYVGGSTADFAPLTEASGTSDRTPRTQGLYSDVHHQPLPEPVPEEQDIHADHDGYQREHVKHDGCLSSHTSFLVRATDRRCSAKRHVRFTPDNDRKSGFPHKVMSAFGLLTTAFEGLFVAPPCDVSVRAYEDDSSLSFCCCTSLEPRTPATRGC